MGIREIEVADKKLVIHELDDVCECVTGRVLTGSWMWDSALLLSHWMTTQGRLDFDYAGKTVLELGAGTGLPGPTAALLGATRVILTDVEALVPGLRKNVESNGLRDLVEVSRLVRGSDDDIPSQIEEVELVLMSDVFFDAVEVAALGKTVKRVCGRGTRALAATEVRPWTEDCLSYLLSQGFDVVELPTQLTGNLNEFALLQLIPPSQVVLHLPP